MYIWPRAASLWDGWSGPDVSVLPRRLSHVGIADGIAAPGWRCGPRCEQARPPRPPPRPPPHPPPSPARVTPTPGLGRTLIPTPGTAFIFPARVLPEGRRRGGPYIQFVAGIHPSYKAGRRLGTVRGGRSGGQWGPRGRGCDCRGRYGHGVLLAARPGPTHPSPSFRWILS